MPLPETNTILYTCSMGKHTRTVFRHAVQQALTFEAKLYYLYVFEPIGEVGRALMSGYVPKEMIEKMHNEGIENLKMDIRNRIDKFFSDEVAELKDISNLEIHTLVEQGNRAETIIDVCRDIDADLIVMGSSKQLGRSSVTTKAVIRSGVCPVMVIPTQK